MPPIAIVRTVGTDNLTGRVDAISGVGQYHPAGHLRRHCCSNLIQGDLRFGLELNLLGHFCLFPPLAILGPLLG